MFDHYRETIHPQDISHWLRLRTEDITSTESPALFGLSPYATAFELWHQKRAKEIVQLPGNDRMEWGKRLQSAIADGIAADRGWQIRPKTEYMRLHSLSIGSSFDFEILPCDELPKGALLEVKNVDSLEFKNKWAETDFGIEAPAHIELQAQHQLLVSGLETTFIGALVGGNRVELLRREFDTDVGNGIMAACAEFWNGEAPKPDFRRDLETIRNLYGHAEPGSVLSGDKVPERVHALLREYYEASRIAATAELDKDAAKAELFMLIGDAERVIGDGFNLSCGLVGPAEISYTRKAYRNFRVTAQNAKKGSKS